MVIGLCCKYIYIVLSEIAIGIIASSVKLLFCMDWTIDNPLNSQYAIHLH